MAEMGPSLRTGPTRTFVFADMNISPHEGDIIHAGTDVVVSSDNKDLTAQEQLATSIRNAADHGFQQRITDIRKTGILPTGKMADVKSTADTNSWKHVFIVNCPTWEESGDKVAWKQTMSTLIRNVLEDTVSIGMNSVAFPLIGTGKNMAPVDEVVMVLCDVIKSQIRKEQPHPQVIEIYSLRSSINEQVAQILDAALT